MRHFMESSIFPGSTGPGKALEPAHRAVISRDAPAMPRSCSRVIELAVFGGIAAVCLTGTPAGAQFGSIFGDPPRPPSSVPTRPDRPPPPPQAAPRQPPPLAAPQPPLPQDAAAPSRAPSGIQSESLPPPPGSPVQETPQPAALPAPAAAQPGQRPPAPPRGTPQPATTAPQPGDDVVTEMPSQKIVNPTAVFSGLDKITGRITTFDVAINETVQFGALQVTPRVCYTRPPTETPNTDSFIEVDEVTLQGEVKRIFTGWTFAGSPGLNGVEHPIYDIWLSDCKGATPAVAEAPPPPPPAVRAGTPPRPQQRTQSQPRPPAAPQRQARPPSELPPPPFVR
jgi:hypothetical protein